MTETRLTKDEAKAIATETFRQLGGLAFTVMTGAHDVSFESDGSVNFKLPAIKGYSVAVMIKLNGLDLYDMTFIRMRWNGRGESRRLDVKKNTVENVYNDQLETIFTRETGLATRL